MPALHIVKPGFHHDIKHKQKHNHNGLPKPKYKYKQGKKFCLSCACAYVKRERAAGGISISISISESPPSCFDVSSSYGTANKGIILSAHAYCLYACVLGVLTTVMFMQISGGSRP